MSVFNNIYLEQINKLRSEEHKEFLGASQTIYNNFYTTVVSTFKWKNLPDTTLPFLPERYLYFYGRCAFFKDKNGKYQIVPIVPAGKLLPNGEYDTYIGFFLDGTTVTLKREDIVIFYDNSRSLPSYIFVNEFAENATLAFTAVKQALKKAIAPTVIECTNEAQLNEIVNAVDYANLATFKATLSKALSKGEISTHHIFDNKANDVTALWDIFTRYRNFFYGSYGSNNIEIVKSERLTERESQGNDEIIRFTLLQEKNELRQYGSEQVKTKFNYDLPIELNRSAETVYDLTVDNEKKVEDMNNEN